MASCVVDAASSLVMLDDDSIVEFSDQSPENCINIIDRGNENTFKIEGNRPDLTKEFLKDRLFRFMVLKRMRNADEDETYAVKRVVGSSWEEEVRHGSEASSKKKSILQKYDLYTKVAHEFDYDVSIFSVQEDVSNIQDLVRKRIAYLFEAAGFSYIYDELVRKTSEIGRLRSSSGQFGGAEAAAERREQEPEFLGDFSNTLPPPIIARNDSPNSVQNKTTKNKAVTFLNDNVNNIQNKTTKNKAVSFLNDDIDAKPQQEFLNPVFFQQDRSSPFESLIENTGNIDPPKRNNRKKTKVVDKKEKELPPLFLNQVNVELSKPTTVPKTKPLLNDLINFKEHDESYDTYQVLGLKNNNNQKIKSLINQIENSFNEDHIVRKATENLSKTSKVAVLFNSMHDAEERDLKVVLCCEMLKHHSSPELWAYTLNEVLLHWKRRSKNTAFINHIEFWKGVSEIVSSRPGHSLNLFGSSAQGYRDALGKDATIASLIDADIACFSQANSYRCIEFVLSALRRIELRCPPPVWPIPISKKRVTQEAIVELANDVEQELVANPLPSPERFEENDIKSRIGDIVCQDWRPLAVHQKAKKKQSIVDKLISSVMGSKDSDKINPETIAVNKIVDNPFLNMPLFSELADAFKLDVDLDYLDAGLATLRSFIEREAVFASECYKEIENETRRVYNDRSFGTKMQFGGYDAIIDVDVDDMGMRRATLVQFFYVRVRIISEKYFRFHASFWKRSLMNISTYVGRFVHSIQLSVEEANSIKEYSDALADVSRRAQAFYMAAMSKATNLVYDLGEVDEDSDALVAMRRVECMTRIEDLSENITLMYKNEMGFAFDAQFGVLAALKLVQLGITAFSLSMAAKLFEDTYLVQVYTQNNPPPTIYNLLGYFLAFSVTINAVLFFVLWILSYVKNLPSEPSLFDSHLLIAAAVDYSAFIFVIGIVALIVGAVIMEKKYFRYDLEGPRAIRAMKVIMFYMAIFLTFIPFFMAV